MVLEGKPIDGEERAHLWIEGESRSSSDAGRRVGVGLSEPEAARPGLIFYSPPRVRRFIFLFFCCPALRFLFLSLFFSSSSGRFGLDRRVGWDSTLRSFVGFFVSFSVFFFGFLFIHFTRLDSISGKFDWV